MDKNNALLGKARSISRKSKPNRFRGRNHEKKGNGFVYLGHIPHGFYEEQIKSYFEQFGKVINTRVSRSRKTGKSKGYGFIEFENEEVAKIAAKSMDNYLMFKKRLEAKFVSAEKMKKLRIDKTEPWSEENYPLKEIRKELVWVKNSNVDGDTYLEKCKHYLSQVQKTIQKLHELGIEYTFTPVDVPRQLTN